MKTMPAKEVVENARKLVLLGQATEAYFLMKKLVGEKEAFSILRGYKTLEDADKGYRVIDDESEEYFLTLLNSYAGKCYISGKVYEPYGITPEVDEEDIPAWILDRCRGKKLRQVTQSYVLSIWADDPMKDLAIHVRVAKAYQDFGGDGESGWVLFRHTSPIPFWATKVTKPLEAIVEWVETFGPLPQVGMSNVIPFKIEGGREESHTPYQPYQPYKPYTPPVYPSYSYTPAPKLTPEQTEELREKILATSKEFYEVTDSEGVVYQIPKEPFEKWALEAKPDLAPDWTPISEKGLYYKNACAYRSDWMIGAGIPLEDFYKTYSGPMKAANALAEKIREKLEIPAQVYGTVAAYGPSGKVANPDEKGYQYGLYVVEEAGAEHILKALKGSAIIAEKPGKLLKMAQMENSGMVVAIVPDARKKFPMGCQVEIDGRKGVVRYTKPSWGNYYASAWEW